MNKHNLTASNYFSRDNQLKYMGVSQFKAFEQCQTAALAEIKGEYIRPMTTALLIGSYVDAYFEGTLDLFKEQHPEIFKRDGTLKSEYVQADYIIERANQSREFMYYMSGNKQAIMTGEIAGVPIKIKVDSLHPDKIVDLKVMKDLAPMYVPGEGRVSFIEGWRYDLQGAVYQEIVRQNTGEQLPFFIAATTKEKEPDMWIIPIPQELLDYELEKFKKKAPMYQLIKDGVIEPERCEHCDWCKKTREVRVIDMEELNYEYSNN